jgi:hypothetical protein
MWLCNYICIWLDSLDYIYICFPTACSSVVTVVAFLGGKSAGTEVHFRLVPRLIVRGTVPLLFIMYTFSWRKQTFHLYLYLYLCLVSERTHCTFEATYVCMLPLWNQMTTLHEVMVYNSLYLKRIRATLRVQFGILTMPPRYLFMLYSTELWSLRKRLHSVTPTLLVLALMKLTVFNTGYVQVTHFVAWNIPTAMRFHEAVFEVPYLRRAAGVQGSGAAHCLGSGSWNHPHLWKWQVGAQFRGRSRVLWKHL